MRCTSIDNLSAALILLGGAIVMALWVGFDVPADTIAAYAAAVKPA